MLKYELRQDAISTPIISESTENNISEKNIKYKTNLNNRIYLYINTYNLNIGNVPDSFLRFASDTYKNFETLDKVSNDAVLKPVNTFFDTLSLEHQNDIAKTLIVMNASIQLAFSTEESLTLDELKINLEVLTNKLGNWLNELDESIDLFIKIHQFVKSDIQIYKDVNLGTRPQDSDEMTFYPDQIEILTALVVLCKILTPIFSQLISMIKGPLDNNLKEIHCSTILTPIVKKHLKDLKLKLDHYILKTINPKPTVDQIYHTYSESFQVLLVLSVIFIRRFISMNIYNPNSKLMVYIKFCAKAASNTQNTNATKKLSVRERLHPYEVFGDDGNTSILECDSQYSKYPVYVPIFIENQARVCIDQSLIELGLDKELFDLMVQDYNYKALPITEINKFLLCIAYGKILNGAKSIGYLNRTYYIQLLVLLQYRLLYSNLIELVPLLSLIPSLYEKQQYTSTENAIRLNWKNSYEYRLCAEKYPISVNKKFWHNKLCEIIELLTINTYIQYFPPTFLELMKDPFESNVPYNMSVQTVQLICKFIYDSV